MKRHPVFTLLDLLPGAEQRNPQEWQSCCPVDAHDGLSVPLTVFVDDYGHVQVHCHGHCVDMAVLDAVGLTYDDLRPDDLDVDVVEEGL